MEKQHYFAIQMTVLVSLWLMTAIPVSTAEKILLMPAPGHSHVALFKILAERLHSKYGHELHMLLPPSFLVVNETETPEIKVITYENKELDYYQVEASPEEIEKGWMDMMEKGTLWDMRTNGEFWMPMCRNPLRSDDLYRRLKALNFKLAIVDGLPEYRCFYVLLYRLGIPFLTSVTQYEPWIFRNPSLPSFVPFPLATTFTEKMTFWERLMNIYYLLDWSVLPRISSLDDALVTKYAPEMPPLTMNQIFAKSLLWLLNSDPVLDYARPTMANVVEVGGLLTKPGKKLNAEMEKLVGKRSSGTIIVSFGSFVDQLPVHLMQKIADAFHSFPEYTIIWKYDVKQTNIKNLPPNMIPVKWLPQNDLLADKRTQLFITHSGNNGQFEAMYHGVPMIGIPIFGDQPYNAAKMQYKGFGIALNMLTFTQQDLVKGMKTILGNPKYKQNLEKASAIFRDREHPADRAAFLVEHVMKFGGEHLHSYALDMPWYEYLMLDILAFLFLVVTITVCTVCTCCRRMCSRTAARSDKAKLKKH